MAPSMQDETSQIPELRGTEGESAPTAHLMGVCGVGMAGVALLLRDLGWGVSGCDASGGPMQHWLQARGIGVAAAHDPAHITPDVQLLVRSSAVPASHPEVRQASRCGVAVARRGEVLARIASLRRTLAVCGTHGKTTTATFAARLLQLLEASPSWCIGGENEQLGGVAGAGDSDVLVVEADESDGTLAYYEPAVTVITNVEFDHMEHFADASAFESCFRRVIDQTRERVVYCADDPRASRLAAAAGSTCSYGIDHDATLQALDLHCGAEASSFSLLWQGGSVGRVRLPLPGRHNVLNVLGAAAAVVALGHPVKAVLAAIGELETLPDRRFHRIATAPEVTVISDYAHHPTEIRALVATASRLPAGRRVAVFQPHRYSRTLALGEDFPSAFDGVDEVILTPVYAASEAPLAGGRTVDLYARFRAARPDLPVRLARSLEEAWGYLEQTLAPRELLLIVGAGDILSLAQRAGTAWSPCGPGQRRLKRVAAWRETLSRRLPRSARIAFDAPLAPWTTLGVGGAADIRVEVRDVAALKALLTCAQAEGWPLHLLGAGANQLVPDLGVRGVCLRLRGAAFGELSHEGPRVRVGAAVSGQRLLNYCRDQGLGGLAFLEGVPGNVGGWLAMNAGTHGTGFCERVASIHCLNRDGTDAIVQQQEIEADYRACEALTHRVAIWAELLLEASSPEAVTAARSEFGGRRTPLAGLHTAGSLFRNPPGDYAGRLLDECGFCGYRLGGARVLDTHANIVVADTGATASDIIALAMTMRQRVVERFGVALRPEVRMLGQPVADDVWCGVAEEK